MGSLYKRFLRLCQDWPLDSTKPGRDLGIYIREKVAQTFKRGESTVIGNEDECDARYSCLQKINSNYYRHQYERRQDTGSVGLTLEQCRLVISTEGVKIIQDYENNFFSNLFKRRKKV